MDAAASLVDLGQPTFATKCWDNAGVPAAASNEVTGLAGKLQRRPGWVCRLIAGVDFVCSMGVEGTGDAYMNWCSFKDPATLDEGWGIGICVPAYIAGMAVMQIGANCHANRRKVRGRVRWVQPCVRGAALMGVGCRRGRIVLILGLRTRNTR